MKNAVQPLLPFDEQPTAEEPAVPEPVAVPELEPYRHVTFAEWQTIRDHRPCRREVKDGVTHVYTPDDEYMGRAWEGPDGCGLVLCASAGDRFPSRWHSLFNGLAWLEGSGIRAVRDIDHHLGVFVTREQHGYETDNDGRRRAHFECCEYEYAARLAVYRPGWELVRRPAWEPEHGGQWAWGRVGAGYRYEELASLDDALLAFDEFKRRRKEEFDGL